MSSLTKKTKSIRNRKRARSGAARKKALERDGSTPAFPIHKPVPPAKPKAKPKAKAKAKPKAKPKAKAEAAAEPEAAPAPEAAE